MLSDQKIANKILVFFVKHFTVRSVSNLNLVPENGFWISAHRLTHFFLSQRFVFNDKPNKFATHKMTNNFFDLQIDLKIVLIWY